MSGVPTMHTFISYSRTDSAIVDRLQADLVARNFDTWVDRQKLEGGQTWEREIQSALDRCSVVLVALSPDAATSPWVENEYTYALRKQKRIIPLLLRGDDNAIPFALGRIQYVDFKAGYESGFEQLVIALTALSTATASVSTEDASDNGIVHLPQQRDLDELYREGRKAQAAGNLDRAYILWKQVLDTQPDYGAGSLVQDLQDVERELRPIRIRRLREQADGARHAGEMGQLIGALEALVGINPANTDARTELHRLLDGQAEAAREAGRWDEELASRRSLLRLDSKDERAAKELAIAEQNQKCGWRYANAQHFVAEGEMLAAKAELERLWREAPYYGDPAGLAPTLGLEVGETYRGTLAREAAERAAREEARRRADEVDRARQAAAAATAEAARKRADSERSAALGRERAEAWEQARRARRESEAQQSRDFLLRVGIGLLSAPGIIWLLLAITSYGTARATSPYFNDSIARQQGSGFYAGFIILLIFTLYGPSLIALIRCLYLRQGKWALFILLTGVVGFGFVGLLFAILGPKTRKP